MRKVYLTLCISLFTVVANSQSKVNFALNRKAPQSFFSKNSVSKLSTASRLKSDSGPFLEKLDSVLSEQYDSTKKSWSVLYKTEYSYDSANNNTGYITFWRQSPDSSWQSSEKEEFTYNKNNQLISDAYYIWDDFEKSWTGAGSSPYKNEYTYNNVGEKILSIASNWYSDTNAWIPAGKSEYFYDNSGNDTLALYSHWDYENKKWIYSEKTKSILSNDVLMEEIHSNYQSDSSKWKYYYKTGYIYTNGNISQIIDSTWNKKWIASNKNDLICNAKGNPILSTRYYWDFTKKGWILSNKDSLTLTSHGDILKKRSLQWDNTNNIWIYNDNYDQKIDTTKASSTLIVPDGFATIDKLLQSTTYSTDAKGKLYQNIRSTYNYSTKGMLLVSTNKISFKDSASTKKVFITANGAWSASVDVSWISLNKTKGNGNDTLIISANQNTTVSNRNGLVTITADSIVRLKSNIFQKIEITQSAKTIDTTKAVLVSENNLIEPKIYPNPNQGTFTLSFENPDKETVSIRIMDIIGNTISFGSCSTNRYDCKDNTLPAGMYLITIDGVTIHFDTKLIIAK